MAERVGLVGLGKMGAAIAKRLSEAGNAPLCWDLSAAARETAAAAGGRVAADAAAVVAGADVVLSIVTDDASVRGLFEGESGILSAEIGGRLFVEMSTLRPSTVRDLLPVLVARGARLIDCPVLGSIPAVLAGQLVALAGGAAEDVSRAEAALHPLVRRVVHMGPLGAGSTMKLAVNLGMATYLQSLAESLALAERQGLRAELVLEVLGGAVTANAWLPSKVDMLLGGHAPLTLDIRTLRKDVLSAVATGTLSGVPMPATSGALDMLSAACAAGWGDRDLGELPLFFREHVVQRSNPPEGSKR